jgi:hypothetical protein
LFVGDVDDHGLPNESARPAMTAISPSTLYR